MTGSAEIAIIQCFNCGANAPGVDDFCPACGAPLISGVRTAQDQQEALKKVVEDSNLNLIKAGSSAAEYAFGIGCSLCTLLTLAVLLISYFSITKTWTILAVIALTAILISALVSALLAARAKTATTRTTYERVVKPEIDNFLKHNGLTQQEFDIQAMQAIAEDAPLRNYLN